MIWAPAEIINRLSRLQRDERSGWWGTESLELWADVRRDVSARAGPSHWPLSDILTEMTISPTPLALHIHHLLSLILLREERGKCPSKENYFRDFVCWQDRRSTLSGGFVQNNLFCRHILMKVLFSMFKVKPRREMCQISWHHTRWSCIATSEVRTSGLMSLRQHLDTV